MSLSRVAVRVRPGAAEVAVAAAAPGAVAAGGGRRRAPGAGLGPSWGPGSGLGPPRLSLDGGLQGCIASSGGSRPRTPPAGRAGWDSPVPRFAPQGVFSVGDCTAQAGQCPRWGAFVTAEASVP